MPSNEYQMWMTYDGGKEKIQFPVLPEIINIQKGAMNDSVSIQGLGEVVIKQDPAAVIISFSSFFPATMFSGVQVKELTPPSDLKDKITIWQKGDTPVRFLVTGTTITLSVTIEDFQYYERGGDPGTLWYTLTLKEYRNVKVRQVKVDTEKKTATVPEPAPARVDDRVQEKTHTVVKGDSLWAIATKHLGSGSRYTEIYELNRNIIKNPNLIYPGQVLKLPA